jgi:hypothetical protein
VGSHRLQFPLRVGANWILQVLAPLDDEDEKARALERERLELVERFGRIRLAVAKNEDGAAEAQEALAKDIAGLEERMDGLIRPLIAGLTVVYDENRKEKVSEFMEEVDRAQVLRGRSLPTLFDLVFFQRSIPMEVGSGWGPE